MSAPRCATGCSAAVERARVRAGLPGPEPASRADPVGRLRRRRHLQPAVRERSPPGRRVGPASRRLLAAAHELGERARPGRGAHPLLPQPAGRRHDPVARERAATRRPSSSWPGSRCRSCSSTGTCHPSSARAPSSQRPRDGHARGASTTCSTSATGGSPSCAGSLALRPGHARLAGMQEAIAARGVPDETIHMPGSFTVEHGETATNRVAGPPRAADRHHRRWQPPVRRMPDRHHPAGSAPRRGHLAGRLRRRPAREDLPASDRLDLARRGPHRPDRVASAAQTSCRWRGAGDHPHPDDVCRTAVGGTPARDERDPIGRTDGGRQRAAQLARGPTFSSAPEAALR